MRSDFYPIQVLCTLFFFSITYSIQATSNTASFAGDTIVLDGTIANTMLCEGLLVDDGGLFGNYSDDQNNSITIESPGAAAYQLNFLTLETEMCCDNLTVTGFTDGIQTFFETFRGNQSGEERTIEAEILVINFNADGSSTFAGFEMAFNCLTPTFPNAQFQAVNSTPCDPEVVLKDQTTGFPNTWTWFLNDSEVATIQNPTIPLASEGTYSIKLIACNDLGCDTLEKVNYIEYTAGQLFCDTTFLFNNLNTFSSECTGVIVDDGGVNGNYSNQVEANLIVDVPNSIGYRITVKNFISEDCCAQMYILKDDGNGQEFVRSLQGNESTPISFEVYGDAVIFNWFSNGGFGEEGFDITWECLVPSSPSADFFAANTNVCNGIISLFDQSNGVPESWEWLVDDVTISNDQHPEFLLANEGIFDVELRVCNSFGCDTLIKEDYITYQQIGFCDTLFLNDFQQVNSCQGVIYDNGGPDGDFIPWTGGDLELNFPGGDGVRISVNKFRVGIMNA